MSDPLIFNDSSPRFGLPYLFPGQSQKEAFVNEAQARVDALMHCAVEGEASAPPPSPIEGDIWLIGNGATAAWLDRDSSLALQLGGDWVFISPVDGMRILDKSTGQEQRFWAEWKKAEEFSEPSGGLSVDSEARTAIASLIAALRAAGILPSG